MKSIGIHKKNWQRICYICISIVLIFGHFPLTGQQETPQEYNLKATFIYNFTKFIRWPQDDLSSVFNICVIGDSRILEPLKQIAAKRVVNNRKMVVNKITDLNDIETFHILFISASEKDRLGAILKGMKSKCVLTVGDYEGFAQNGVAINFVLLDGKIKFELNKDVIEQSGLQVSSQLQKLAIIVEEE